MKKKVPTFAVYQNLKYTNFEKIKKKWFSLFAENLLKIWKKKALFFSKTDILFD